MKRRILLAAVAMVWMQFPAQAALITPSATLSWTPDGSDFDYRITLTNFYPGTPVGTSFVYPGAPFSDAGHPFVVEVVPEPSSAALWLLAAPMAVLGARTLRSSRSS